MNVQVDFARKVIGAKIAVIDATGAEWVLNHRFPHRDHPSLFSTLEKIRERGVIDTKFWHKARKGEC